MTKQTIEIDVPEGMEIDDVNITQASALVYFKKKPLRRRVFECVSEEPRQAMPGEWFERSVEAFIKNTGKIPTMGEYKIFKEIKE